MKLFALIAAFALIIGGACLIPGDGYSGFLVMLWGVGLLTAVICRSLMENQPLPRSERPTSTRTNPRSPPAPLPYPQPLPADEPRSVKLSRRRILIDGQPRLVFAGEVHYFRLKPEDWEDRLDKLKANGLDTVATYIPWIWHELPDGSFDLNGRTHPQRNLVAFLDLCAARGLDVIARPGPFVMAELKNEGVPYRLYRDHPHVYPITWNGAKVKTRTLDYLAPEFLAASKSWYAHVMPVLAERLATVGGPVTAVQLDNEIGMLSWVSNSPDLTDVVCEDMRNWARTKYGDAVATQRIGADVNDPAAWAAALRAPAGAALPLHHDLGLYMRDRFRRYVGALRSYAEEYGVTGVPFLVNVHGTGGGRGKSFPIGISQLFESYRGQPQMTSGSDFYLGDLTTANVSDLYLANAFMAAVHDADQPTSSLEFEAGNGDYGDDLGNLYSPEGIELKTRLCIAQGNRLLNYYLHAGGENPHIESVGDGIDRVAFTGQRHGFAAPVGPEGQLNATYHSTGRVVAALRAVGDVLADSDEENDGFAIGFVPDHYMTEYRYPGSSERAEQIADIERFRGSGPRDMLARMLLLGGYSFPAVDLQAGVPRTPALVLGTGRTLGAQVQRSLADYVRNGGKLLIAGLLPDRDEDGNVCNVLAEALGLKNGGRLYDSHGPSGPYWPVVVAQGWAAPRPEVRVGFAQLLEAADGSALPEASVLLKEVASGKVCGAHVRAGAGEAIVIGCDYGADIELYKGFMTALGIKSRFQVYADAPGVMVTSTISSDRQRLLHLLNVAPHAVSLTARHNGKNLFGGRRLHLPPRAGLVLPLGVRFDGGVIKESTAEIVSFHPGGFTVRPAQQEELVIIETSGPVSCTAGLMRRTGTRVELLLRKDDVGGKPVTVSVG